MRIVLKTNAGFSLLEMLVVISIVAILSGSLILTFSRGRSDLSHSVNIVVAEIRDTQTRAITGVRFKHSSEGYPAPVNRCGYGVTPTDATQFIVYAGLAATDQANCVAEDKRFQDPPDKPVRTAKLLDAQVEFKIYQVPGKYFYDIFFEAPQNKTFIDNNAGTSTPALIVLGPVSVNCNVNPEKCRAVCIYTNGKIELPATLTCPVI